MEYNKNMTQSLTPTEIGILERFPVLTEAELEKANGLFSTYLTYKAEGRCRRVWTSCCNREEVIGGFAMLVTPETQETMWAKHNDRIRCPFCGKEVTVKCRGKFRTKELRNAVFLATDGDGNLFAQAYWMKKDYGAAPAERPEFRFNSGYYFSPGAGVQISRSWYSGYYAVLERERMSCKKTIKEPFFGGAGYEKYRLIGADCIKDSFIRYVPEENQFRENVYYDSAMRWILAAAVYPRQMEMLRKAGQHEIIDDLVYQGRKNARFFTWEEKDPRKAFRMTKTELKEYFDCGYQLAVLDVRATIKADFATAMEWMKGKDGITVTQVHDLAEKAKKHGLSPQELRKYLLRFTGPRSTGAWYGVGSALITWKDYLVNAEAAGFDLRNRNLLLPRDLEQAHQNAMEIVQEQKQKEDRKQRAAQNRKAKEREAELNKMYRYETEHFMIRAPKSAEEIIAEGNALKHCVGGYAKRHADGAVTILFLRDKAHPKTPLCTIEMRGTTLVQIHGYKNEREKGSVDPKLRFAEIYEPWIAWVKAGSKRRKDGTPIVPKKKERKTA